MQRLVLAAALTATSASIAHAQFTTWQGTVTNESAWRAAVVERFGSASPLESFESYQGTLAGGTSDQVTALPALGVTFDSSTPGAYPGVYNFGPHAHTGVNQLANFGGGLALFQDYNMRPQPGRAIFAVGLWQCDPQGDLTLDAYDHMGELVGTIVAPINNFTGNSFGGFISSMPIGKVTIRGNHGDGYNHLDDLQVVTRPITGPLCAADVGIQGGLPGVDGILDNNDFIAFINFFFAMSPAADRGTAGGLPGADEAFDNNDFIVFITQFFDGC